MDRKYWLVVETRHINIIQHCIKREHNIIWYNISSCCCDVIPGGPGCLGDFCGAKSIGLDKDVVSVSADFPCL